MPVTDSVRMLRLVTAQRTSALAREAETQRKVDLARRFTPGMPARKSALLEALRRQTEQRRTKVNRMTAILRAMDEARARGIPLSRAFAKK